MGSYERFLEETREINAFEHGGGNPTHIGIIKPQYSGDIFLEGYKSSFKPPSNLESVVKFMPPAGPEKELEIYGALRNNRGKMAVMTFFDHDASKPQLTQLVTVTVFNSNKRIDNRGYVGKRID